MFETGESQKSKTRFRSSDARCRPNVDCRVQTAIKKNGCPPRQPSLYFSFSNNPKLDYRSASSDQVDDQYDHGYNQQQMDQAACYMEAESQKPENQQNGKNGPEHNLALPLSKSSIDKMGAL
jgi:hypothetical protein